MSSSRKPFLQNAEDYVVNMVAISVIKVARALPYAQRVRTVGSLVEYIIGPLVGFRRRAKNHLMRIMPELTETQCRKIASKCLNNAGRTFIENYSSEEFPGRMAANDLDGPGFDALKKAAAEGRPVILVTGHYGNYEAVRAALVARGYPVGGLYRNMKNPYFNAHYVRTMEAFGGPVFPQGRKGTSGFVKHLKQGGQLVLLFDQHVFDAPALDFLGKPALTAVSAAQLALRYNAVLIPFYGIRRADGLSFDTVLEPPIETSDAVTMTQALNDSLSARIKADPTQWFWVHRRWRAPESPA